MIDYLGNFPFPRELLLQRLQEAQAGDRLWCASCAGESKGASFDLGRQDA